DCNPALGSEKGQVEKNVKDARRRAWQRLPSFADIGVLDAWLEEHCITHSGEIQHGGLPGTVAGVHAKKENSVMPLGRFFIACIEHTKRVSPFVSSTPRAIAIGWHPPLANRLVSVRINSDQIVVPAEG
ncbi:IS21 family transposase, partial [Croceicoccus sp. F390]|nr:IS21 family transposase [Croceicoccus sp. F390]